MLTLIQQSYATILDSIQQAIILIYYYSHNNLSRYNTPINTASQYVTIILLIQHSNTLLYSNWYSKLIYSYTLIDTTVHMLQPKQQAKIWYPEYKNTAWLSMNKAAARPLLEDPRRCAHQERLGGRQANCPRLWILCYYCVFSVLSFVLSISASPKTHKPRGRASDVSTISTCFFFML